MDEEIDWRACNALLGDEIGISALRKSLEIIKIQLIPFRSNGITSIM